MRNMLIALAVVVIVGVQVLSAAQVTGSNFEASVGQGIRTAVHEVKAKAASIGKNSAGNREMVAMTAEKAVFAASGKTHFARLKELYAQGYRPKQSELVGFYSGRCYRGEAPNEPMGVALVGQSYGKSNGPLFPSFLGLKANIARCDDENVSDCYDNGAGNQEIIGYVENGALPLLKTKASGGAIAYDSNINDAEEFRIRKSGAYFFAKEIMLKNDKAYHAGDVTMACYFFQKVHD